MYVVLLVFSLFWSDSLQQNRTGGHTESSIESSPTSPPGWAAWVACQESAPKSLRMTIERGCFRPPSRSNMIRSQRIPRKLLVTSKNAPSSTARNPSSVLAPFVAMPFAPFVASLLLLRRRGDRSLSLSLPFSDDAARAGDVSGPATGHVF